jgi:hypothetical protein
MRMTPLTRLAAARLGTLSPQSGYHMHTSQDVYLWRTKIVSLINGSHWSSCDYHLSARGIPKYLIEESFLGCVHNV